jgi:hypothetical protein
MELILYQYPLGAYTQAVRKGSSTRAKFNEKVVAAMRMKAGQVLARAVDKQLAGLHVRVGFS